MPGSLITRCTQGLDRLIRALTDPARAGRTMLGLLAGYIALWSLYGAIAKSSQDVHFDMGEAVVWSHFALAGAPKHPPLSAWLVRIWFAIFPRADWAYYLFGIVLAAVALWAAWKVSERFLPPEKRVAGIVLLTFVPFYNFHALKFNANLVMLPLWALTTWAFIVAFQTRRAVPAALTGLAAAGAMLGKYWSVMLLAGLGVAALADPRLKPFLRSRAPWIIVAVGFAALLPYLVWLLGHPSTFTYALASHPGTVATSLMSGLRYVISTFSYAAAAILVAVIATRPSRAALSDTIWPRDPDRRFALTAFIVPILLPAFFAVATTSNAVSLWGIGGMTLLPVVMLSSPRVHVTHEALRRILVFAMAIPLLALLASPVVAVLTHRNGLDKHASYYRLVAQAVEQAWRAATPMPLRIFGSYDNLLNGSAFYFRNLPKTFEIVSPESTPWTSPEEVARDGIAMVCPQADTLCMTALDDRAARAGDRVSRSVVELRRMHLGIAGDMQRFVIAVIPPG